MQRALITGGTGFVGKHLIPYLHDRGTQIAVLAQARCGEFGDINCYEVDIREATTVRSAIHDFKPNHIYHLAAISSVPLSWSSPHTTYEVNVFGTLNVLEAAMSLPSPPTILNVSTAQVYAASALPLMEESAVGPGNPYAASKLMAELLNIHANKSSKTEVITVRSFNHAGPGQSPEFVLSSIAKQFAEIQVGTRERKLLLGNVHVRRDFTDVRDVIQAYSFLLEKGGPSQTYNVCSGRATSIKEIVDMFQSIAGIKVEIETHPDKMRAGEVEVVCGSPAKIHAATGWKPRIPLETTLRDLLSYWRDELANNRANSDPNCAEGPLSAMHLASK